MKKKMELPKRKETMWEMGNSMTFTNDDKIRTSEDKTDKK